MTANGCGISFRIECVLELDCSLVARLCEYKNPLNCALHKDAHYCM